MKKLCVFDLDGTLVNTLSDLAASLNYALRAHGFPTLTEPEVSAIVGHSVKYMCAHAVPPEHIDDAPKVLETYMAHYREHCCDHALPYEGMLRAVMRIRRAGMRLAVVSNKPHADAVRVLETLYPKDCFSLILGHMQKFDIKPAPDSLNFVLDFFGVTPEEAVYVGDSDVDVIFAHNAGLPCVSVSWGFRTRKELLDAGATDIVDDPDALLLFLKEK